MTAHLKTQLMEKYLHSQGTVLYREGRVDEAIALLEQAVALIDRSYTRYQLSLVFKGKGNLGRALEEMDRAIALNPSVARYYYEKSLIKQMGEGQHEARRPLQKAIDLDENYGRMDEIREALDAMEEAASPGTIADSLFEGLSEEPMCSETAALIEDGAGLAIQGLDSVSCTLPCPAFCCYFEGSPVLHGLTIGPWKLLKIREFLRGRGLDEDQFLDRIDLTGEKEIQRLIPPHHQLSQRGCTSVYAPKKGRSRIDPALLASLPQGRGYQDLVWIHDDSWACSFLDKGRCMIHDVGDEPALPACKDFFCLTGFVFALLIHWDLITEEAVGGKTMGQLNRLAVEAALIVSRELCRAEDLNRIKASLEEVASEALKARRNGCRKNPDREATDRAHRMRELADELVRATAVRKALVKRQIGGL